MTRSPAHFAYQPALDGLRAVAVLAVVAYHFGAGWARGGFLGVDLFFVLSGYLITSLLLKEWDGSRRIDLVGFWGRRARRLLPAVFLLLVAVVSWGRWQLPSTEWGGLRHDAVWSLFYGANWHFIESGQSYFTAEPSMLRHMWSLAIEEQFYVVWPLLVLACLALGRGNRRVLVALCLAGTVASIVVMRATFSVGADPSRPYYGTDARASQLLIGALLALGLERWSPASRRSSNAVQAAGLAGAIALAWMFWAAGDQSPRMYGGGFALFAVCCAAVVAAVVQPARTPLRTALSLQPARWVGQISYGLYLWHWPVAVALSGPRLRQWGWDTPGFVVTLLRLAATLAIATASYYAIELPIRHRRVRWGRARLAAAPLGFAVVLAIILATTTGATANLLGQKPGTVIRSDSITTTTGPATTTQQPTTTQPPTTVQSDGTPITTVATIPATVTSTATPMRPGRVLLLGDSVAASLGQALSAAAGGDGVELTALTRLGCGLTTGRNVNDEGKLFPQSVDCAASAAAFRTDAINEVHPDVVLWLSTWELSDFEVDGEHLRFATPEWERWFVAELEGFRQQVAATGAVLVIVNNPTLAPNPRRTVNDRDVDYNRYLNGLFARFAAGASDIAVLDLAEIVCPGGPPCPTDQDGVVLRPVDGGHFDAAGAAWTAPRLLKALYTLYGTLRNP